jgi:hypothetical protein
MSWRFATSAWSASLGIPANSGVAASARAAAVPMTRGCASGISSRSERSSSVDSVISGWIASSEPTVSTGMPARSTLVVCCSNSSSSIGMTWMPGSWPWRGCDSGTSVLSSTVSSAAPRGSAIGRLLARWIATTGAVGCFARRWPSASLRGRDQPSSIGAASGTRPWRIAATCGFSCSAGLLSAMLCARVWPAPICSFISARRRNVSAWFGSICRITLHTAIAWTRNPFCA